MKTASPFLFSRTSLFLFFSLFVFCQGGQFQPGEWKLVKKSIGISAMHMALLPNNKIITFDRTDYGPSNISLPSGRCRRDPHDQALTTDCSAHSVEFDPADRSIRPLTILTDTWCSSGALFPDGKLVQTGGFNDGDRAVRYLSPCPGCDWVESQFGLSVRRWYSSNQLLPSGKMIIVGGRGQFNYEFIPKASKSDISLYDLKFLRETRGSSAENNLYPFLHLLPDGNLFVFANTRSILLDYVNHRILRTYPEIPGGDARNYPSCGSSALLPLVLNSKKETKAEILVCGGAPPDSNAKANSGVFMSASKTCGRLTATDDSPEWVMEEMPLRRVMGDMIMLPTGDILIINGAAKGTAGWGVAREPVLEPVLYRTGMVGNRRFEVLRGTSIPRMYHSTAHLLPDGRVLVGGSNPNIRYDFMGVLFPTELSLEAFSPPYLIKGSPRPTITRINPGLNLQYKTRFSVEFDSKKKDGGVYVTMVAPSFTTHSYAMNQRLLVLEVAGVRQVSGTHYVIDGYAPATSALAPPGHYLVFVVHGGVPSPGKWVHISSGGN
ncbi:Glyoxal oxidase [Cinnamomum micranthum f. kanehirae]|uniref:Glyoxal oxidase n=1 Tax=Cinnamomum micranthum f. kanehirae TaxID=337451 RepID=A0A443PDQ2_9MAGN|nr:Glyoxal oxidase [Cinnamomum micranthum f. kanehirae]